MLSFRKSILTLCLLAPLGAQAQFSYNAVELSLIDVSLDSVSVDGDGYEISGSFEINDDFFILGSYQDQSYDFGIDGNSFSVGVGYHNEIQDDLDFVGTASFVNAEVDAFGGSADDDGLALAGGVRAGFGNGFQADAMFNWVDFDSGSDTYISLTGRYYFKDTIAGFVRTGLGQDNFDVLQFGVRFEFE